MCQFLHNLHNMSISAHVKTFIHSLCFGMNMVSNECSCCGIYDDDDNYEVVDSSAMRLDPWCWWLFLPITFITEYQPKKKMGIATDTKINADQMIMMVLMIMIVKLLFSTTQTWPNVNDSSVMNI